MKKLSEKARKILIPIITVLAIVLSFFSGYLVNSAINRKNERTLSFLTELIDKYGCYYDEETGEVKEFTAEDYANAIVKTLLDKYSAYYTKEEYSDVVTTSQGKYYGVGVSFLNSSDSNKIYKVVMNSPAEKAGLKDGDEIKACEKDGVKTALTCKAEITEYFSSLNENEEFKIYVLRNGTDELEFTLSKKAYLKSYVKYFEKDYEGVFTSTDNKTFSFGVKESDEYSCLNRNTAYIYLSNFEGESSNQIKLVFERIKTAGKTEIILDMRGNGGGYMDTLCDIASYFIYSNESDKPVVARAIYKNGKQDVYRATGDNFNRDITKITVLADENTASASECLIGAMLYYGRAFGKDNLIIVNESFTDNAYTYGKGIMQRTQKNILTGEAVKLTVAKVYQPDGLTSIHGTGLKANPENSFTDNLSAFTRALALLG